MAQGELSQIELLANYIMAEVEGEPSRSEGAGDCAIRLLRRYRYALDRIMHEIGVPGPGYYANVANAYEIASGALSGQDEPWFVEVGEWMSDKSTRT